VTRLDILPFWQLLRVIFCLNESTGLNVWLTNADEWYLSEESREARRFKTFGTFRTTNAKNGRLFIATSGQTVRKISPNWPNKMMLKATLVTLLRNPISVTLKYTEFWPKSTDSMVLKSRPNGSKSSGQVTLLNRSDRYGLQWPFYCSSGSLNGSSGRRSIAQTEATNLAQSNEILGWKSTRYFL